MPSKAEDYRRQAEECFVRAKRARSSATKARYIELMCQWLALANQIELEEKAEDAPAFRRRG
jgi:hypothetical protein